MESSTQEAFSEFEEEPTPTDWNPLTQEEIASFQELAKLLEEMGVG